MRQVVKVNSNQRDHSYGWKNEDRIETQLLAVFLNLPQQVGNTGAHRYLGLSFYELTEVVTAKWSQIRGGTTIFNRPLKD